MTQDEGSTEGELSFHDCTEEGLICREDLSVASCGLASLLDACYDRNSMGCSENDEVVRCVWVSEQPVSGLSGDIGAWQVETDCAAEGQVCVSSGGNPACENPS